MKDYATAHVDSHATSTNGKFKIPSLKAAGWKSCIRICFAKHEGTGLVSLDPQTAWSVG